VNSTGRWGHGRPIRKGLRPRTSTVHSKAPDVQRRLTTRGLRSAFKSIEVALECRSAPASEPTVSAFLRTEQSNQFTYVLTVWEGILTGCWMARSVVRSLLRKEFDSGFAEKDFSCVDGCSRASASAKSSTDLSLGIHQRHSTCTTTHGCNKIVPVIVFRILISFKHGQQQERSRSVRLFTKRPHFRSLCLSRRCSTLCPCRLVGEPALGLPGRSSFVFSHTWC
jgi:hypothetical protein